MSKPKPQPRHDTLAPDARASAAVDPAGDRGYLFGGWRDFGGANTFNDTWRYDLDARRWTQILIN